MIAFGIAIAAAAALMMVFYGGDVYFKYVNEAEAARLVGEGAQIEAAVQLYYQDHMKYPASRGDGGIQTLVENHYLDSAPPGDPNGSKGEWIIDYDEGQIRSRAGDVDDPEAQRLCITARRQLKFANPEKIYRCDGSDHPDGVLSRLEPCCIRG